MAEPVHSEVGLPEVEEVRRLALTQYWSIVQTHSTQLWSTTQIEAAARTIQTRIMNEFRPDWVLVDTSKNNVPSILAVNRRIKSAGSRGLDWVKSRVESLGLPVVPSGLPSAKANAVGSGILGRHTFLPCGEWATNFIQWTVELIGEIEGGLWEAGWCPGRLELDGPFRMRIMLSPLTPLELEVRPFLTEFRQLELETAVPAKISYATYREKLARLDELLQNIGSAGGKDQVEVWAPALFRWERLEEVADGRHQLAAFAIARSNSMDARFRGFQTARDAPDPIELRIEWEDISGLHKEMSGAQVAHWLSELAPAVPELPDIEKRYAEERPAVMQACLQRRITGWESLVGSRPEAPVLEDILPLVAELRDVTIPGRPDWQARLLRLGLISLYHGLAVSVEPPGLHWLWRGTALLELASLDDLEGEALFAAARQMAAHIAERPDLVVSLVGDGAARNEEQNDTGPLRALELMIPILQVVVGFLHDHARQLTAARKTTRTGTVDADLSALRDLGRPLQRWLMSDARPWFMAPGMPPAVQQAYRRLLNRMEDVTGLAWVWEGPVEAPAG